MKIRRFQPGEEMALHRVFFSAIHEIAARDYTREQILAWAPSDADPELWVKCIRALQPFVVVRDEIVLGYADLQPSGYIDHFYVSASCPRQGVGRRLMARLHEEASVLGIAELSADVSVTAQPFFLANGFHIVRQGAPVCRGVMVQNALMKKTLA